ncbi:sulfotransferase 1C2-like [Dermacentor variabilis]|uniref:sulfotransferase 1C2-like n=1 Tax=Dermacentor variabilis TaxID=34621 RepID=UPI003F5B9FD0
MQTRDLYSHYGCGSQRYVCEDGDVILVSYPGCGVHWVQQIVQLILNSGQSAQDYAEFMRRTPFLDRLNVAGRRSCDPDLVVPAGPRTLKTHLQILRGGVSHSKVRYVYVARNPWDCCASLYHRVKFSLTEPPALVAPRSNFDEFFDLFVKGKFSFGDYFDHVRSAYDHRDDDNVFFVTFEDLKADREGVILKLGHFLGEEYGEALENCGVFANVCEKSSFDYMKRVYGAPKQGLDSSSATASTSPPAAAEGVFASGFLQDGDRFCRALRSGKVNGWKELFTLEHRDRMKVRIAEKTKGSDLMNLWKLQSRYKCLAAYS